MKDNKRFRLFLQWKYGVEMGVDVLCPLLGELPDMILRQVFAVFQESSERLLNTCFQGLETP